MRRDKSSYIKPSISIFHTSPCCMASTSFKADTQGSEKTGEAWSKGNNVFDEQKDPSGNIWNP